MTALTIFREYEPWECGDDGYPIAWHRGIWREEDRLDVGEDAFARVGGVGVKHVVREQAGHRCERCRHPYVVGESGVLEGPHAHTKGLAAELGVSVETFQGALEEFIDEATVPSVLEKARRTNWSPCDERCTHAGPYRYRLPGWEEGQWCQVVEHDRCNTPQQSLRLSPNLIIEAAWRILTVHHLNGRKHDLRWWNLVALCQRCHLSVQTRVQMERVYPFEHSDWFKPYAAGWYAYAYLGETLTREQAMERLDDLLALERAA